MKYAVSMNERLFVDVARFIAAVLVPANFDHYGTGELWHWLDWVNAGLLAYTLMGLQHPDR
jgi:hypothetical protein